MNETLLRSKKIGELRELAKAAGVPAYYKCKKEELVEKLLALAEAGYSDPCMLRFVPENYPSWGCDPL